MIRSLRFTLGVTLAVGLVACGSDDEASEATTTVASVPSADSSVVSSDPPSASIEGATEEADSGTSATATVTIEHYSGTDEVPVNPETIVVMDLGMLLTLDSLGIEADGFGSLGTDVPEAYAAVVAAPESMGTAFEPDYEAINALEPDLIIVATRSSATYPDMSEIAPTVDMTFDEGVDYMTAFRRRHEQLGRIFGVEDEVAAELDALDAQVAEISSQTADAGDALIVMTSGAEVSAYGPGSRFGMVHDVFGYGAADESLAEDETHGEVVSFEFIAEAAPDAMFVIDRAATIGEEAESAESVLNNDLVTGTPARQNDRVVYADGFSWYLATNSIPGFEGIMADVTASLS